jgi:hypothetical protein
MGGNLTKKHLLIAIIEFGWDLNESMLDILSWVIGVLEVDGE